MTYILTLAMSSLVLFSDVDPVAPPQVAKEVVPIAYPEEYATLMGYFRAVMQSGETSTRVLELTADILEFNAAHYSVWHLRRKCLYSVGRRAVFVEELEYAEAVARACPKNYQIWYHRREMLEKLDSPDFAEKELEFVSRMLASDAKNYHAWSHRLWVLRRFECWHRELEVTDELLKQDEWNNSAWNHRHSVLRRISQDDTVCLREVEYAVDMALRAPRNESPWVYALSFARSSKAAADVLATACDLLLSEDDDAQLDPLDRACARMTRLDLLADKNTSHDLEAAAAEADKLALLEDPFRVKYWSRRAVSLRTMADKLRPA